MIGMVCYSVAGFCIIGAFALMIWSGWRDNRSMHSLSGKAVSPNPWPPPPRGGYQPRTSVSESSTSSPPRGGSGILTAVTMTEPAITMYLSPEIAAFRNDRKTKKRKVGHRIIRF